MVYRIFFFGKDANLYVCLVKSHQNRHLLQMHSIDCENEFGIVSQITEGVRFPFLKCLWFLGFNGPNLYVGLVTHIVKKVVRFNFLNCM